MSYESEVKVDSPKIYYRLGEASGVSAADASGNALAGTYKNAPTLGVTGALVGDANTAIALSGVSQFIERAHNALLNVGDVFTFEAWVKRVENGHADVILYKEAATKAAKFAITAANKLQLRIPGVKTLAESTIEVKADGLWHHLVATKNVATIKLYVDGVDVTGTPENETCQNNEGVLCIGSENTTEEFAKMSLDEVAYYSTALSEARVKAHFLAGTVVPGLSPALPNRSLAAIRGLVMR